ncbi:alpha/beta hydrolase [Streptomyces sp. NPDC054871]
MHDITLTAGAITLSGMLAEPPGAGPAAVVVALHGAGMSAGYFHSQARPGLSLLELGAGLGYTVLAVDRPGYGASARDLPLGQHLADQAATLREALTDFAREHDTGAGFFVVAHSNGGKLALATAADPRGLPLLGVEISGLGSRLAVDPRHLPHELGRGAWRRHWGSLRLYPPGAFRLGQSLITPVPAIEAREGPSWPELYPRLAGRVHVPTRFTFAEQEQWWRHDEGAIQALLKPLAATRARVERQPDAGHNISLGWAARTYHLRALAFLEECRAAAETRPSPRSSSADG